MSSKYSEIDSAADEFRTAFRDLRDAAPELLENTAADEALARIAFYGGVLSGLAYRAIDEGAQ